MFGAPMTAYTARGAYTALATPFHADGSLDASGFAKLVRFQVEQGVAGIVPAGTTGESPTLSWDDHARMLEEAVAAADGRVSVIAGTGSNNTEEAIEGTSDARRRGANAVLLVDCYYNGPSSLELRDDYYQRVLDAVPEIPIVPYVIPGRTGCALAAEDLAILHARDPRRVSSVKQATGDLERMRLDRSLAPAIEILSGDDDLTLPMMRDAGIRASGVISVMSNLAPAAVAGIVRAETSGDAAEADRLAAAIAPLTALVTVFAPSERTLPDGRVVTVRDKFRNPVPVKAMMAGLGMLGAYARPPLGKMTASAVRMCREALVAVHAANPSVLTPIEAHFEVSIANRLADDAVWSALVRA